MSRRRRKPAPEAPPGRGGAWEARRVLRDVGGAAVTHGPPRRAKTDPGKVSAAGTHTDRSECKGSAGNASVRPHGAGDSARMKRNTTIEGAPAEVSSVRALGRVLGVAESTVRKWQKRVDWPFGLGPPWDAEEVLIWRRIHIRRADRARRYHDAQRGRGPVELSELEKARTAAYQERAAIYRLRRQELEGSLHDVDTCRARRLRQIAAVKRRLLRIPRSLSVGLVGRNRREIERLLRDEMRAVLNDFAGKPAGAT